MPVDFSVYNPPGVYVEEDITPLVSIVGAGGPTVVAIVGPSVGYRVHTQQVTLVGTTDVELAKLGIDPSSITVTLLDGTAVEESDYTLTVGGGEDADEDTLPDNTLSIKREGSGITDGDSVFVSYQYTDALYYEPTTFRNFEDVKDAYGPPLDQNTSAILSPLTLAAKIAFENGAQELLLVAAVGDASAVDRDDLSNALDKLESAEVDIVVTLPVGITGTEVSPGDTQNVVDDLKAHCETMSNDLMYRVGIIGHETTVTNPPDVVASATVSDRIMLAWPNQMTYYNGFANQSITIAGYYLAAAYAGIFAGNTPRDSLTRKRVHSFTGIAITLLNTMSMGLKNTYSNAGVAVTERLRNGNLVVRHGTSTNRTNINTREFSVTRAEDALMRMFLETVEATGLIGSPIDGTTLARVKSVATGVLETAKNQQQFIVNYDSVGVRQRSADPSVIEIKFRYLPAYPLNYIVISFAINLQSGQSDIIDQTQ